VGVVADKIKAKQRHNAAESSVRGNEESERWRLAVSHEKEMLRQGSEVVAAEDDTRRHSGTGRAVFQSFHRFTSIRLAGPQLPNRSQLATVSQQVYIER